MHLALDIVPIQSEAEIACSLPVRVNFVVLFEYAHEVLYVCLVDVLHAEIVNDECKTDGAPVVSPVPWCDLALVVTGFVESLGEEILRDDTCLRKTIHAASYLTKHIAIRIDFVTEAIFFDDVWWEHLQFHAEVFIPIHRGHEVEVFDVDCHEFAVGGGDDAVEQQLDCEDIGCGCATVVGIIDKITTHCYAGAIGIRLLRAMGAHDATVRDVLASVLWDHFLGHESNRLSGGGESSDLFSK